MKTFCFTNWKQNKGTINHDHNHPPPSGPWVVPAFEAIQTPLQPAGSMAAVWHLQFAKDRLLTGDGAGASAAVDGRTPWGETSVEITICVGVRE